MDMQKQIINGVSTINAMTGVFLTPEQEEVVYKFNDSMSVFANPGTGKTTTAVSGLIAAQTVHGIQGNKILAMSFTKLATAEIASRYKNSCKKCNVVPNIKFSTFHSLCYKIIRKVYPGFNARDSKNIELELKDFKMFLKDENVLMYDNMYFVKEVYNAINSLNNEMLFSKNSVENSYKFMKVADNITLKQFQMVRSRWFKRNFLTQTISSGDMPTMVLFILLMNPEVTIQLKKEYDLIVVDEFQDMSVLYLEVLSLISNKLIVIGDLKQQIFGFNGASLLILDAYKQMYPDASSLELTQSFRCSDSVVQCANNVIAPNEIEGYLNFKGTDKDGAIRFLENSGDVFDLIVDEVKEQQNNKEYIDMMFLARNNASVVPIIEKLYNKKVVFRTTKFSKVMELPIFKDLCMIANVALHPREPEIVANMNRFFPEFKWLPATQNPIIEVMGLSKRDTDRSLLTIDYRFQDSSFTILNKMRRFVTLNEQGQPFSVSCMPLLDIYEEFVIEGKWWTLDQSKEYYFNLVDSIISNKTFNDMVYDEEEKFRLNEYYSSMNEGVRCYTFHSSKGLEASKVYLLDVDDTIIPKEQTISSLIESGCVLEAARELRNERNLLYVAITRCKVDLTIVYNDRITKLIDSPTSNGYTFLDTVWREKSILTNETKAFKLLLGVGTNVN